MDLLYLTLPFEDDFEAFLWEGDKLFILYFFPLLCYELNFDVSSTSGFIDEWVSTCYDDFSTFYDIFYFDSSLMMRGSSHERFVKTTDCSANGSCPNDSAFKESSFYDKVCFPDSIWLSC